MEESILEFEETCLAGEESSDEELESLQATKLMLCDHCDQLVSRSTFYRHQSERHIAAVDSEEEQFDPIPFNSSEATWPSDGASESFKEALLESSGQQCDAGAIGMDEEGDDMDHNPTTREDSESEFSLPEEDMDFFDLSSDEEAEEPESDEMLHLEEVWDEEMNDEGGDLYEESNLVITWELCTILIFIVMWQFCFGISDAGVTALFLFLSKFFHLILLKYNGEGFLHQFCNSFPKTIKRAFSLLVIGNDTFTKFIVCPLCDSVFEFNFGYTMERGVKVPKRCPHVKMPNHPMASQRQPCGALLMKTLRGSNGNYVQPFKMFPYQSVKDGLIKLLSRKGFLECCEHWRKRSQTIPTGTLCDVFEGRIWQDFMTVDGVDFLKLRYSLCFTLNVDWFQSFVHTQYSVGVIYLVIQNLPRSIRYKRENVILIGLIPGPKEPKLTVNSFLHPMVQELKELWSGVTLPCSSSPFKCVFIRAALTCCSCDVPATRKSCGFVGHNAGLGCSKCKKFFPSTRHNSGISLDFSGYDEENWTNRSLEEHRTQAYLHLNASTKAQQKFIEKNYGIRYSILLELPYWDPIKFSVVDPMHNLFLGTGKRVMQIWINQGILSKKDFQMIEKIVAKIKVPHHVHVGRISLKIASSYSGFTADEWRNWITIFSPIALKGLLDPIHLRCWLLFVRACYLICHRIITTDVIDEIHLYLIQFCKLFEDLYGADACTPNMHLHLHLKECLLNYGPVHGFWCYGFERYNGRIEKYHTNNQSIEVQLMRKFLRETDVMALNPPREADELFNSLQFSSKTSCCSYESCCKYDEKVLKLRTFAERNNVHSDYTIVPDLIYLMTPVYKGTLSSHETQRIQSIYNYLYPGISISYFSPFYLSSKKCIMAGELLTSGSVISAFWPVESTNLTIDVKPQVGRILKFMKHAIKISESNELIDKVHIFCITEWYMKHHSENHYGSSATVCFPFGYTADSCQFMPIQRICNQCAHANIAVNLSGRAEENVLVAIPIHLKYCV